MNRKAGEIFGQKRSGNLEKIQNLKEISKEKVSKKFQKKKFQRNFKRKKNSENFRQSTETFRKKLKKEFGPRLEKNLAHREILRPKRLRAYFVEVFQLKIDKIFFYSDNSTS